MSRYNYTVGRGFSTTINRIVKIRPVRGESYTQLYNTPVKVWKSRGKVGIYFIYRVRFLLKIKPTR